MPSSQWTRLDFELLLREVPSMAAASADADLCIIDQVMDKDFVVVFTSPRLLRSSAARKGWQGWQGCRDAGFRVSGLGLRVEGSRVSGFRLWALGFTVSDSGDLRARSGCSGGCPRQRLLGQLSLRVRTTRTQGATLTNLVPEHVAQEGLPRRLGLERSEAEVGAGRGRTLQLGHRLG